MENLELVETLRGQGTFIMNTQEIITDIREEMVKESLDRFIEDMQTMGYGKNETMEIVKKHLNERE